VHLRWLEQGFPVEITIHDWSQRGEVFISSITGKPMKRADLEKVRKILGAAEPQPKYFDRG
jgi:hypothetical protein